MSKLSLDQFLRGTSVSTARINSNLLLPEHNELVDRNGNKLISFLNDLNSHVGLYEINETIYDSVVFTGSDNVYFSYEFNPNSGKALAETLFILSSLQISKKSDNTYELVESTGQVSILILKV